VSLGESLDILFEDNHCLAINKPAGWPTTHFAGGEETVDRLAKAYLKEKYAKPGKVFLGVVHRLDKPVSGVLLFARTSKAAARLSQQFRDGAIEKVYWAVIEGSTSSLAARGAQRRERGERGNGIAGTLEDWLLKDDAAGRIVTATKETTGAQHALLHYEKRAEYTGLTLLELRPQTGRKHQLRVQLASRGLPIYGDKKYGSKHSFGPAIALHARSLTFLHPTRLEPITLKAEVPNFWKGRFAHLLKPGASK
jgi:23S rRNA pseudouridine1911/1915/1917 synthase